MEFVRTFQSIDDMTAYADARLMAGCRVSNMDRSGFIGRPIRTWRDAVKAAGDLWPEGVEIVEGMIRDIESAHIAPPVSRKRRLKWDADDGDEVDHDRLRNGQEFWRKTVRQETTAPQTLTVVVQMAASGVHDSADI